MESQIHNKTRIILAIGRFFGVFPVNKITDIEAQEARFSFLYCYSLLLCIIYAFTTSYALENFTMNFESDAEEIEKNASPLFFYATSSVRIYLLIKVAKAWPNIIKRWSKFQKDVNYVGEVKVYQHSIALLAISNTGKYNVSYFKTII